MNLRNYIATYCTDSKKKPTGVIVHSADIGDELPEMPDRFFYMAEWSDVPSRRIWKSEPYQSVLIHENGQLTIHEHLRKANFRIHLLELEEKYETSSRAGHFVLSVPEAFEFAYNAHRDTARRFSRTPYISHPMDVASILLKNSAPDVIVIAGLLYSIKKESKIDMGEVENKFGETVVTFVRAVSELDQTDDPTLLSVDENMWKKRNEACLKALEGVGRDVKLLFCADKLASIRDMRDEENIHGNIIWNHFIVGKESYKWYYDRLLWSFESQPHSIIDSPMYKQLKGCVEQFFSDA